METTTKRRRTLPRSVSIPQQFLSARTIRENNRKAKPLIETTSPDRTLTMLNWIGSGIMCLILTPMILGVVVYVSVKWILGNIFVLHYPVTREGRQIMATRKYLHQCKH